MSVRRDLSTLPFEVHGLANLVVITGILVGMYFLLASGNQGLAFLVSFAIVVFLVSLVRIDFGLGILIIGMLFSPETEVAVVGQRELTIRAEDLLIIALGMAWVVRRVIMGACWIETPLNMPIFVFLVALIVSTAAGVAFDYFLDGAQAAFYIAKLIQFFAIYYFAIHFIEDEAHIHFFLALFLAVGAAVSIYGLTQVGDVYRVSAPFEGGTPEPNTFGGYLMTLIALSLPLALYCPRLITRIMLLGVAGLAFSALLFTLSRASFLGLLGMLIVLGFLTKSRLIWMTLILFAMFHRGLLPEGVLERINYTFASQSGALVTLPVALPFVGDTVHVDSSTFERIDVWRKVMHTWTLNVYHFFFGWGVTRGNYLDSQYARFLIEIGLVGFTAFGWILWRIFRAANWLRQETDDWIIRGFSVGYIACFVGVLIHSMGTITFYIVRIMEPFWFLTGVMMWWYLREREAEESGEHETPVAAGVWQPDLPWRQVDAY